MTFRPLTRQQIVTRRVVGNKTRVRLSCSHDVTLPRRMGEKGKMVDCEWCLAERELAR